MSCLELVKTLVRTHVNIALAPYTSPVSLLPPPRFMSPEDDEDPNAWQDNAMCAKSPLQSDLFFASTITERGSYLRAQAQAECARCSVRPECLEFGLGEDFGIWGGLDEDERADLYRRISHLPKHTQRILIKAAADRVPRYH